MTLKNKRVGFALTGCFCNFNTILSEIKKIKNLGAEVFPILSNNTVAINTKLGRAQALDLKLYNLTGKKPISQIVDTERVGPQKLLDILVIAPCSGNTLAKLANAITDTSVLMAAKAQLRNQRPVVIAVSTNDGLGLNAKNLGILLNTKNVFFVPFGQDNPLHKQNSLVADFNLITPTIKEALRGKQLQPLLIQHAAGRKANEL